MPTVRPARLPELIAEGVDAMADTRRNAEWSITVADGMATIEALEPSGAEPDLLWQPRAGNRSGVGIPLARLGSLIDVLDKALAAPGLRTPTPEGDRHPWSRPGMDRTERVVYLRGPVICAETGDGYALTTTFRVPVGAVPELCTLLRSAAALRVR